MKKIAFLFTQAPHGTANGREGLDMLLASSAYHDNISVYFLSDGVFQLLPDQAPEHILSRNYITTFGVLALYDIEQCYICAESLEERGLTNQDTWIIDADIISLTTLQQQLTYADIVLTF